jgi:hypothetical protein
MILRDAALTPSGADTQRSEQIMMMPGLTVGAADTHKWMICVPQHASPTHFRAAPIRQLCTLAANADLQGGSSGCRLTRGGASSQANDRIVMRVSNARYSADSVDAGRAQRPDLRAWTGDRSGPPAAQAADRRAFVLTIA